LSGVYQSVYLSLGQDEQVAVASVVLSVNCTGYSST